MSKLTGSKNVKQLIKEWNNEGNKKGLFKRLKEQCKQLQLPRNGSTADLVQRLIEWLDSTKTKSLKTEAIKKQNQPLLENIVAKSKDSEAINAAKNELKTYGIKSQLNEQLIAMQTEFNDFNEFVSTMKANDPDKNEMSGHLIALKFKIDGLKQDIKEAGNEKLIAAKAKKAALLARMRKQTLKPVIKSPIELPIEAVAIEIIEAIEPTEIEETIEDSIEIVHRKKKALRDSKGQLIKAVLRNSKTGWEWQLLNEEGKATGETIGTDKARQNSQLALYDVTESIIEAAGTMIEYQDRETGEWRKRFKRNCLFPINSIVTNLKTLLLKAKATGNDFSSIKKETNPMRKLPSRKASTAAPKKSLKQLMSKAKTVKPAAIEEDSSDPFADYEEEEAPVAAAPVASRRLPGRTQAAKSVAKAAAPAVTVDNSKELNELKAMIKAQSISISALVQSVNKLNETVNAQTYSIAALKEVIETVEEESEANDEVEEAAAVKPVKKKAAAKRQGGLSEAAAAAVELAQLVYDDETDEAVTFTVGMLCEFRGMELRSAGPVKRSLNGMIKAGQLEAYDMGEIDSKGNEVLEYGLPGLAD